MSEPERAQALVDGDGVVWVAGGFGWWFTRDQSSRSFEEIKQPVELLVPASRLAEAEATIAAYRRALRSRCEGEYGWEDKTDELVDLLLRAALDGDHVGGVQHRPRVQQMIDGFRAERQDLQAFREADGGR